MMHLINIAVHGTKQRNLQATTKHLQRLNGGLQLTTVEAQLLLAFGMKDLERRAGYVPARITDDIALPPAPIETQPLCSHAAIMQIYHLMRGALMGMIDMWIDKFIESGQRIPPEWIPALLQSDEDSIYVLGVLCPLLGERGKWLAQVSENPAWLEACEFKSWDWGDEPIGFTQEHVDLLALRLKDASLGLQWLEHHWRTIDDPNIRYWCVDALQYGLNNQDAQFLWERVQDKAKHRYRDDTAGLAALLLTQLPATKHGKYIIETAANTCAIIHDADSLYLDFRWTHHFENRREYLSRECLTPLMRRLKTQPLSRVIRLIPLENWIEHWQRTPLELIDAALNGSHAKDFIEGWFWRTNWEKHSVFASALLEKEQDIRRFLDWKQDRETLCRLIPWQQYETLMTKWLQD